VSKTIIINNISYTFNRYYIIRNINNIQKEYKNSFVICTNMIPDPNDQNPTSSLSPTDIKNVTIFTTNGLPGNEE
jgi:hypothetical protein